MLAVLRRRNFALLWFGQLISMSGDLVLITALPFYIYQLTGSVSASGAMFIVQALPSLLFGTVAGVFVDRWDRRWTMIVTDALRALILLFLLVVHSRDWLWLIYGVAFVEATLTQFFWPAKSAIIPRLVDQQDLLAANSLNVTSEALTRVLGPSLGGALLGLLGLMSVVFVDVASYAVSCAMILFIVLPSAQKVEEGTRSSNLAAVWQEWLSGLKLVYRERLLGGIFLTVAGIVLGGGITTVIIVAFVRDALHGGALEFGWMLTAQGLGTVVGALAVGFLGKVVKPISLIVCGIGLCGVGLLLIANIPILVLDMVLLALVGLCAMGFYVTIHTLLQKYVIDAYRGRVFAALNTNVSIASLIGMGLGSILGVRVGAIVTFNVAAGIYLLAAIVPLVMLRGTAASARLHVAEAENVKAKQ